MCWYFRLRWRSNWLFRIPPIAVGQLRLFLAWGLVCEDSLRLHRLTNVEIFLFLFERERERENFGWEATRGWSRFFCTKQTAPFVLHKIHMLKKIHCVLYDTVSQCDGKSARPSGIFFLIFFSPHCFNIPAPLGFSPPDFCPRSQTFTFEIMTYLAPPGDNEGRCDLCRTYVRLLFFYFFYYYYYWAASQTLVLSMFSVCVTLNDSVRACVT